MQKLPGFKFIPAILIILFVNLLSLFTDKLFYVQLGILAAVIIYTAYQFIVPLIYVIKNGGLAEILDKYGYSEEYLNAYEKAKILNKPFDLTTSAEFAQIYVYTGQSEKAVKYLESITLPEVPRRFEMVKYLTIYILALLRSDQLQKAEELWAKNSYYINRMKTIKNYSLNVDHIFLMEIYIECYAAYKGDKSRLDRAYELTAEFLNSGKPPFNSFDIILLYELKALGKTEEFGRLYPAVLEKVGNPYYIFNFLKIGKSASIFYYAAKIELSEFEKAASGLLPFLD